MSRKMSLPVTVLFFGLILIFIDGISAGVPKDRTMRVVIRKDFALQPDGTYKEVSSNENQLVDTPTPVSESEETGGEGAESAPPMSFAYSPYPYFGSASENSSPYLQFTAEDVQDVMRQLGESQKQPIFQPEPQPQRSSSPHSPLKKKKSVTLAPVRSASFKIEKAPAQSYYLDEGGNSHPSTSFSVTSLPKPAVATKSHGAPNSIQEIIRKPEGQITPAQSASQDSHYYSPKELSYSYDSNAGGYVLEPSPGPILQNNYEPVTEYGVPLNHHHSSSPGTEYGVPITQSVPIAEYGAPILNNNNIGGWSSSYNDKPVGGVVHTLVDTVKGVGKTKAAQVSSVLHQKGELGSQILNQGGNVVSQTIKQGAEKATIIAQTLSRVPARFSQVLRTKANIATGLFDHGSRALGTALHVKAQAANTASNVISATGKASSAVIRAGGGTAANLILAKGKGIAHLITSGGNAASAILNRKGNTVAKIAEALGGVGLGHQGGGGWGTDEGISGGYSENQEHFENVPSGSVYIDKLQDALKTVVNNPVSSYGSPPSAEYETVRDEKLTSAFQSIYNDFKEANPTAQTLFGSYSAAVEVTAKPEEAVVSDAEKQPSIGNSAAAIGESLNKMSKMFNNVANVIDWLTPSKSQERVIE